MISRVLETERDRERCFNYILRQPLPCTITIEDGRKRSIPQNRLMWMWATEVAMQRGDCFPTDVQAEWKLNIGVPMLIADDQGFATDWNESAASLPYEKQLRLMRQYPVTRLMTSKQLSAFLTQIQQHCTEMGWELTVPDDMGLRAA